MRRQEIVDQAVLEHLFKSKSRRRFFACQNLSVITYTPSLVFFLLSRHKTGNNEISMFITAMKHGKIV